jgi:hypothetical protein
MFLLLVYECPHGRMECDQRGRELAGATPSLRGLPLFFNVFRTLIDELPHLPEFVGIEISAIEKAKEDRFSGPVEDSIDDIAQNALGNLLLADARREKAGVALHRAPQIALLDHDVEGRDDRGVSQLAAIIGQRLADVGDRLRRMTFY